MRISDWSSDVCSSDLEPIPVPLVTLNDAFDELARASASNDSAKTRALVRRLLESSAPAKPETEAEPQTETETVQLARSRQTRPPGTASHAAQQNEHTPFT